jgi:hypothetical protein
MSKVRQRVSVSVCTALLILVTAVTNPGAAQTRSQSSKSNLNKITGVWEVQTAKGSFTLLLNADGSGEFNGEEIHWTYSQNVLSITDQEGTVMYNAALTSNSLTISGGNLQTPVTFRRSGSDAGPDNADDSAGAQSAGGLGAITGSAKASGPTGTWQFQNAKGTFTMTLSPGGTGKFNNDQIRWEYNQNVLTLKWESGDTFMYNAKLSGDSFHISGGNLSQPIDFQRAGSAKSSGGLDVGTDENVAPKKSKKVSASDPGGDWEVPGPNGIIHLSLMANGTGTFGGGNIHWTYSQRILSMTGPNGNTIKYNAAFGPGTMTLSGGGLETPLVFRRPGAEPEEDSQEGETRAENGNRGLVGSWQGQKGSVTLNADGSAVFNGISCRYSVEGNTLTMSGTDGDFPLPFTLSGNTLTLTIRGEPATFKRGTGAQRGTSAGGGNHPPALAGQWCFFSGSNTGQISSASQECVTLNSNGTYTYSANSDSSNQYGGTASQGSDQGTWSVSGSTMTANSQSKGVLNYQLELRNNKNNDPMICLDGRCFATTTQKTPW